MRMRDLPFIVSILFTRVRTEKLRDSGNSPDRRADNGTFCLFLKKKKTFESLNNVYFW